MNQTVSVSAGYSYPLGATLVPGGVNFAVFSANATQIYVCLFDDGGRETRHPLPEREGDIWHGLIEGIEAGQLYGLRADGPYEPQQGHRFNVHKLLLDPYARRLTGQPVWDDALMGYTVGSKMKDLSFDTRDSAPFMPRCVVEDVSGISPVGARLATPLTDTVIYEAHTRGLTMEHPEIANPGSFTALASDPILDHLSGLGVTAIELLPVHAFLTDSFLVKKQLTNFWGYQSIGFFAPDTRYLSGTDVFEFRAMVDRFHGAEIEVLLDVVYNHSGEGDELGPTLSFRGLDNASYYRLQDAPRRYLNDTGTGNAFDLSHPMVLRMVLDSLRYWVEVMGVDGFRFDLCSVLGRTAQGFSRDAGFFQAVRQDPVLSGVKLIAEPWDIGPGGYQLGNYPPPFLEWNDAYRDGVRNFWRGAPGAAPDMAARLMGSAQQFDHSGRLATSSVTLLTSHDGFTLTDLVSYSERHNEANGEGGRDGHGANYSDNMGVEGPSGDPAIQTERARRRRNMMASLLLSQGTPMILGGDEIGNSQGGNNNAYAQDNSTAWINWAEADHDFLAFTQKMIALRKAYPVLRQKLFLHGALREDGHADLIWHRPDGAQMLDADWEAPELSLLALELRPAAESPNTAADAAPVFAVFNAGSEAQITLPAPPEGQVWRQILDTAQPDASPRAAPNQNPTIEAQSVVVWAQEPPSA